MNDRVKELIAWRDEYVKLSEELKTHPGMKIYNDSDSYKFKGKEKQLVNEYGSLISKRNIVMAKIQSQFLFMVDRLEELEQYKDITEKMFSQM